MPLDSLRGWGLEAPEFIALPAELHGLVFPISLSKDKMEEDLYEELTDILAQISTPHAVGTLMTTWEIKFCQDMRQRHERWGKEVKLTDKQWAIMRRIKEKIDAAD